MKFHDRLTNKKYARLYFMSISFESWCENSFMLLVLIGCFLNSKGVSLTLVSFVLSERKRRNWTRRLPKNKLAKPWKFCWDMDHTTPKLKTMWPMSTNVFRAEHLEITSLCCSLRCSLDLLTLSEKPQALVKLSAYCFASCFSACLVWRTSRSR